MKEERLLNIFGDVDDKFIEKSAPKNLSEKIENQQFPVIVSSENKSEKREKFPPMIKIISAVLACAAVLGICFGVKHFGGLGTDLLKPADLVDNSSKVDLNGSNNSSAQSAADSSIDGYELKLWKKYSCVDVDGRIFFAMGTAVEKKYVAEAIDQVVYKAYDPLEESFRGYYVSVYPINNISQEFAVAVKFSEDESFYVYYNRSYSPETLGDYIDDLNLTENMKICGTASGVSVENAKTVRRKYHGIDSAKVWEMFLSNRDCWNVVYYNRMFTAEEYEVALEVAFDIPILGIKNGSLSITKGGLVYLNSICDHEVYFFVGKDKTDDFVNYVKENCYSEITH